MCMFYTVEEVFERHSIVISINRTEAIVDHTYLILIIILQWSDALNYQSLIKGIQKYFIELILPINISYLYIIGISYVSLIFQTFSMFTNK